jgi:hypothetical protein
MISPSLTVVYQHLNNQLRRELPQECVEPSLAPSIVLKREPSSNQPWSVTTSLGGCWSLPKAPVWVCNKLSGIIK